MKDKREMSSFHRLHASETRPQVDDTWYQSLYEWHPDAVISVDRGGRVRAVNRAFEQVTGFRGQDCLGRPLGDLLAKEEAGKTMAVLELVFAGDVQLHETALVRVDGRPLPRKVFTVPVVVDGRVVGAHAIVKGQVRRSSGRLAESNPLYDRLTNLPDWPLFTKLLEEAIDEAQRKKTMLAIMFIDLDRFKYVNDVLGHHQGDQLLKGVAEKLLTCVRVRDVVARIGGDKFTVFLRDIRHVDQVTARAERMLEVFKQPFVLDGQEFFITPSIGISLYPLGGNGAEELLKYADTAMFHAKEKGGNTYQIFHSSMNMQITERLALETNLRKALERGELEVYYQPQVDLRTQRLCGLEALLRWRHEELGVVSPERFIPVAEETGLILPITEWLLATVCATGKAWEEEGYPPVRISVNLSPLQFQSGDLVATVQRITRSTGFDPRRLGLEITESVLMKNTRATVETLQQLKQMGVYVSVDDFGTGYSSLGYLKRFPLDCLKIDRSFVHNVRNDSDNAAIVTAIITLAHHMKLTVIAEGVETEEERLFLAEHGCDAVQGYLTGKPVPADECRQLLASWSRVPG